MEEEIYIYIAGNMLQKLYQCNINIDIKMEC